MKKLFFFTICILVSLSILTPTSSLMGLIPPDDQGKTTSKIDCKNNQGTIIAYGNTCVSGQGICMNNPCPWDKIQ